MCGINGIFSLTGKPKLRERILKMNEAISHRGPDASDLHLHNDKIGLGHVRLSIIDVRDIANQPMLSASKDWALVFNGEIYNYQEIRKALSYNFITTSDTEVILAAVQEKGIDWFLDRANGMFAICLLDLKNEKLILARDRMGIKPLYYSLSPDGIVFSSEIKGILSSGLVEAQFNELAVDEYLANRYIRAPFTFFKEVHQIKPGYILEIDKNLKVKHNCYWDLPKEFNSTEDYDEAAILQDFDIQLHKAIKYRLISDVPLGTYLSGGVDSSLITAITSRVKKETINSYTIGFEELNEFEYSKIIAHQYKTSHHEILMAKEDYQNNWRNLIEYKDAPLGVPNEIPLAVMSSKLKEKITVVLSGEGADELLGGYGRIFRSPFDYQNGNKVESYYDYFISKYEYVSRKMRDEFLSTPKTYREDFDKILQVEFSSRPNHENVFRFFHKYHVVGLLQRVDMTTMQTAVEARVPFLDHNLIEFCYKEVPYDLKLKWRDAKAREDAKAMQSSEYSEVLDTPKYLLRKLAYKYIPKEIIERKKVGFPVPLSEWFSQLEQLANKILPNASWLKAGVVDYLVNRSKKEARAGQILWMFINIELFKNAYFQKEWRW